MKKLFDRYWIYFLAFIFLILGLFYYSKAYSSEFYACEYEDKVYVFEHPLAIQHMNMCLNMHHHMSRCRALAYDDCKTNAQKVQFHKENGERCYKDAKDRCWWLPNISERDKARYCFTTFGVLASPGEPKSKIIIAVISALIQYGLDCSDEWHYINNKLYWSQYHFEMMEFHQDLIKRGYS